MTLAALIEDRARCTPDTVALREKRRGIWRETTWAQYRHAAAAVAEGLRALGVGPGAGVTIRSGHRPEWLYVAVAVEQLEAELTTDGKVLVAEGQEQVDEALERPAEFKHIVYFDRVGVWKKYHSGLLMPFDELLGAPPPTTRRTRAAPELLVSWLPPSVTTVRRHVEGGSVLHFGGDLREVQPTTLLAGPEEWTALHAGVVSRLAGASRLKRANARLWLERAPGSKLGWLLCHRALRERIGLRHLRHAVSAGPVPPEVHTFFERIGIGIEVAA